MITLEKLDRIGLDQVQIENFADEEGILDALEGAAEQGRQGWGVRREQAVILGLARSTRVLAKIADQADTAQRNLKGEQMAHGRLKKRYADVQTRVESLDAALNEALKRLAAAETQLLEQKALADDTDNTVTLDR